MLSSMSSENECARDEHGNLKDASEISFFFSPSDDKPMSGPVCDPPSPSPLRAPNPSSRPQRNSDQSKFYSAIAQDELGSDCDNLADNSQVTTVIQPIPKATATRKRKKHNEVNNNQGTSSRKKKATSHSQVKGASTQLFLKGPGDNEQVTSTTTSCSSPIGVHLPNSLPSPSHNPSPLHL